MDVFYTTMYKYTRYAYTHTHTCTRRGWQLPPATSSGAAQVFDTAKKKIRQSRAPTHGYAPLFPGTMLSGSIRFLRESGAIGKLDKLTSVLSDNSSLTFSPSACISSLSLLPFPLARDRHVPRGCLVGRNDELCAH